jgi:tRNA(Arg) A34 adenosine deaminase TadA
MRRTDEEYMESAYEEACASLREGNRGFGAVVVDAGGAIIARSHDTERTEGDPTLHAEITAVSKASRVSGPDLKACAIFSTHEPCPMCAAAIFWAGIRSIAYGFPTSEALSEGRRRIDIGCEEIFRRAGREAVIQGKVLYAKCSLLYRKEIREEIERIRNRTADELEAEGAAIGERRLRWLHENPHTTDEADALLAGYSILLEKLRISEAEAPIAERSGTRLVFRSMNPCPTLEACKILGYDTRIVCRHLTERAADALVKAVDPRLKFARSYERIRPYCDYCEESIELD